MCVSWNSIFRKMRFLKKKKKLGKTSEDPEKITHFPPQRKSPIKNKNYLKMSQGIFLDIHILLRLKLLQEKKMKSGFLLKSNRENI
jgi:hypothetical protein